MVNIGAGDKVPFTGFLKVQTVHIVRIPVQGREVDPVAFLNVGTYRGNDIGLNNGVLGLVAKPTHRPLANPNVLVSSRVVVPARVALGINPDLLHRLGIDRSKRNRRTVLARALHHEERIANMVYSGRMGNRDEASGDGYRFRGRGCIQLTGHSNCFHSILL